jgi:2',3'-cyclic-nucleotide 2'-phosphodiesterase (5'-nucleotidase family)
MPTLRLSTVFTLVIAVVMAIPFPLPSGANAQDATPGPAATDGASPVLLFAAPGLRLDQLEQLAAGGEMPAFAALLADGARAEPGMVAPVPATTGLGLPTLLSGAWPAEHGIVNDVFYRTGSPDFADVATWTDPGLIQIDTLPQAVERAGKTVASIGWPGVAGLDPALQGPVVDQPQVFSPPTVLSTSDLVADPVDLSQVDVTYDRVDLHPATGWTGAPDSFSPAQETELEIPSLDPAGPNPDRSFAVYLYDATDDATTNYDHLLVAPEKDAAAAVADLGVGAWADVPVELQGERAGQRAAFWVKAIDLDADLAHVHLYTTPISRFPASWTDCQGPTACGAPGGFEEALNRHIGALATANAALLRTGLVDMATLVEQDITVVRQETEALRYIVEDLGARPDLLLVESELPADLEALALENQDATGLASPVNGGTPRAGQTADGDQSLRPTYAALDDLLATGQGLLGANATTMAVSLGGAALSSRAVNASRVLVAAGLAEQEQPGNCLPGAVAAPPGTPDPDALPPGPKVKACWAGGAAQIYVNLEDREAAGSVAEDAYEATRDAIVAAFEHLTDPQDAAAKVVAGVYRKEALRDVAGSDALHPSRTGDVVVVLEPPYRFDDPVAGMAIAPASPQISEGYLSATDNEGGLFLVGGPGIAPGASVAARAIDVAPTAAFLLRVPGPYNASGSILLDALRDGANLREVTLLDISDFHGQLPPLSAVADANDAEGAVNTSYDVGGVAVLAPWFDRYRAQAHGETWLITAGDAVGATPPISSTFGDLPTIEAMNALGFTADGLGNHNFDAGAPYMFGTLAPAADYPYLSANLVPARADGATPAANTPFRPSLLRTVNDVRVGLVGFSNPDIPLLTRPGALDPYRVIDPAPAVNREAARLRGAGAQVVIAMGHMGATGGTLTEPTGPVVDLADQLAGVDAVIGDHTDVQVSTTRPNGVLLTENRSKGVMFTRVRLIVDVTTGKLIYQTADFHRPWVIGMTPDPGIAATLQQLQTQLAPRLGRVVGSAVQPIPRADICGMETGRTCESLIGDIITDAMRLTYGTDFALTNSGGIRADLTCPPEGGDFCPADSGKNAITEGQVLTVLPFGNVAVTLDLSGTELKAMLEAGVARMPEAGGGFPQVSGFCFTYDLAAEPGDRVTGAVRQAADGTCGGDALDLTDATTYTLTTNDFTASGGDGYPSLLARANTRDILASVVTKFVSGESPLALPGEPLDPMPQGRIVCQGEECPTPASG